ncbi:hypothetical protein PCANB_000504 [Pneumocystis canis]|nr:hypothetical protein PCK1_000469 [Pneumocystis canis]KAG5437790.1 hypothetical protein PCANB_000504 [Pneumocystis canis]
MQNEILKFNKTDENSLKEAIEMAFNEVYLRVIPNKFFENQNLMRFEEKFQKAISYIIMPKTHSKLTEEPSAGKKSFVGCVFNDSNTFLNTKNRPGQRRKRNFDVKKQTLISRRTSKQDARRSTSNSIERPILPRLNMYASKKGPKWQRSHSLPKSFAYKQNFQCLPIIPDVTEVIVNKRNKRQDKLYQSCRKINLDYLWMMHWKLQHQKKVYKKYSTRHILFRILSKARNMQSF